MQCPNCGALQSGLFCASCGQRRQTHPPTVRHLVAELLEGLTHADSRLWLTLRHLLMSPGFLTREFFAGRRERYLPPFRLYIFISVAYFLILALMPNSLGPSISLDADGLSGSQPEAEALACQDLKLQGIHLPQLENRLRQACVQIEQDSGVEFGKAFLRAIPRAMFVLLPLFAFVMLAFFWNPRRLYAEHFLLLVHNHSACFFILGIEHLMSGFLPAPVMAWITPALVLYLLWTVWRSMDYYYAQPRPLALVKAFTLITLYVVFASLILAFTGLATALSL